MNRKVADIIVEMAGVQHCYGIVGDTLNKIAERIDKSSNDWVHVRHEEAGAFAAQGEAPLTGQLSAARIPEARRQSLADDGLDPVISLGGRRAVYQQVSIGR